MEGAGVKGYVNECSIVEDDGLRALLLLLIVDGAKTKAVVSSRRPAAA
jgi:hypothetical protein